jgi:hypothetical protein
VDAQEGYTMKVYDRGGDVAACWGNVQTCGSKWFCPVCAAKERQERAEQLAELAARHLAEGGELLMFTPTIRHHNGQPLRDLVEAVQFGWTGRVANGGAWVSDRRRYGIEYIHRSVDLTIGPNGWHPHLHVLLFLKSPLTADELAKLRQRLWQRFARGVEAKGCEPPLLNQCKLEKAVDDAQISRYVSTSVMKQKTRSAGMESVRHDMKNGRRRSDGNQHFTPFEILRIMQDWGIDEEEEFGGVTRKLRDVWAEYEAAMSGEEDRQGVHAFDSSPGLWQYLDELREKQNAEEEEEADDLVWEMEIEIWTMDAILREPGALARAQTAAEVGRPAFERFIDVYRCRAAVRFEANLVDSATRADDTPLVSF